MRVEKTLMRTLARLSTLMQLLFSFDQAMQIGKTLKRLSNLLSSFQKSSFKIHNVLLNVVYCISKYVITEHS
jgi:hypothetical protein